MDRAAIFAGLIAIAGATAFVGKERAWEAGPLASGALATALVAFLVARIALGLALSRPGPACGGSRPARVCWDGQVFQVTFASPAYGRRVEDLNPRRM